MQDLRIETPGVLITPTEEREASALARLGNDREIARMMYTIPHPFTEADALARIRESRWQGRPGFRAAIRKPEGQVMGEVGLGTAGAGSMLSVADCLEATVYKDNPASMHLLEKFGFQTHAEGINDRHLVRREPAVNIDYRLTRADWEARLS